MGEDEDDDGGALSFQNPAIIHLETTRWSNEVKRHKYKWPSSF